MQSLNTLRKRKGTLLRYANIVAIYKEYAAIGVPCTKILKNKIYPIYPISYRTMMHILTIPIAKELKEVESAILHIERSNGKIA